MQIQIEPKDTGNGRRALLVALVAVLVVAATGIAVWFSARGP
jgi:hypothetical protein